MVTKTEAPPTVAEIAHESGATAADLHRVAPDLSIHMLRHILRGTSSGITYAVPLAGALYELAEERRNDAERYERAAEQLKTAPPPTVAEIIGELGVSARTLQRANPEHLNVNTLVSILRKGKGRISGDARSLALADALSTLAEEQRQNAERYQGAADRLRTLYPDRRVFKTVAEGEDGGDRNDHIITLAWADVPFRAIARSFDISTPRVAEIVEAYEYATGERIPRHGRSFDTETGSAETDTRFASLGLQAAVKSFLGEVGSAKASEIVKGLKEGGFKGVTPNLRNSLNKTIVRMVQRGEAKKTGPYVTLASNEHEA